MAIFNSYVCLPEGKFVIWEGVPLHPLRSSIVGDSSHPSYSKILAMAHRSSQISKVQFIVLVFPGRPRILVLVTHLWSGLNGAIYTGRIWRSQVIGPVIGDRQGVVKAFQAHIGEPVPWLPWGELLQMYIITDIKGLISEMWLEGTQCLTVFILWCVTYVCGRSTQKHGFTIPSVFSLHDTPLDHLGRLTPWKQNAKSKLFSTVGLQPINVEQQWCWILEILATI